MAITTTNFNPFGLSGQNRFCGRQADLGSGENSRPMNFHRDVNDTVSIRFSGKSGDKPPAGALENTRTAQSPADVKLDRSATTVLVALGDAVHIGTTMGDKLDAPYSWPIGLIKILLNHGDVVKYLKDQNLEPTMLFEHFDRKVSERLGEKLVKPDPEAMDDTQLAKAARKTKLSRKYVEDVLCVQLREWAFREGITERKVNAVDVWRWVMSDPAKNLNQLFQVAGISKQLQDRLLAAPAVRSGASQEAYKTPSVADLDRIDEILSELPKRVVGQDQAIEQIADGIETAMLDFPESKSKLDQPKTVFLVLGPSGVGKTYTGQQLAELLERPMEYQNLSQMGDEMDAKRLSGSAPGYAGYGDGGSHIDNIIEHNENSEKNGTPAPVVVYDEVEKAHATVIKTLMQFLDLGRVTNEKGQEATFRDSYVMLTSNVAQELIYEMQSQGKSYDEILDAVWGVLEKHEKFPNEVRGRIKKVVFFNSLEPEGFRRIFKMNIDAYAEKLKEYEGINLEIDDNAYDVMVHQAFSRIYGAREVHKVVTDRVKGPVTEKRKELIRQGLLGPDKDANGTVRISVAPDALAKLNEDIKGLDDEGQINRRAAKVPFQVEFIPKEGEK